MYRSGEPGRLTRGAVARMRSDYPAEAGRGLRRTPSREV